jgi:hypothetical protein
VAARDLLAARRCRMSELMTLVDAMPPDSCLAAVVIIWVAVEYFA